MISLLLSLVLINPERIPEDGLRDLRVGHWVEVRGEFDPRGRFVAQKIEALSSEEEEVLIGTVAPEDVTSEGFVLLGQPIAISDKTEWSKTSLAELGGTRVKVEGYWRGPRKFSARAVKSRGEGRDRVGGRIDAIEDTDGGLVLRIMRFEVFAPENTELESPSPLADLPLAPERVRPQAGETVDEDDLFGKGFALTDTLRLSGQLEGRAVHEGGFDLDDTRPRDRDELEASGRLRMDWNPSDDFHGRIEVRHVQRWRDDERDGHSSFNRTRLGETYGDWGGLFGSSWALRVGRQDFDDQREWLYDQNLDAVRTRGRILGLPVELSLSTTLAGGDREDEALNAIAYVSNGDEDRHLAGWVVHRNFDLAVDERRTHFGGRALGEWYSDHESWLEVSGVHGRRGDTDLLGWGYDIGTTWTPDWLEPFAITVGYALGSGGDPEAATDRAFRQTGLQDNNAKFGGVTSFRYYGELLDPELSNLGVATVAVGTRLAHRTSLDLVLHHYRQDVILPTLTDTDLDMDPDGEHADLGWEADLVLGWRELANWDLEVVGAVFHPLAAFPTGDDAFLLKIQLRRRF